ncbi:uncharacterized acetyltransferase At3g50280 [Brachypodium distachyon]|uniref:Acetyltransferase n=1 Tax=Brachypodium distachyon TaxID=15368 RepID=I1H240_BRADI|nr:uncharacterized acetyltransferase At3g50280 [Brachypodium distachyon]KQK20083.1 hypothetical protein BRADI_1g52350v3 [Brachypodium distachyon]|eukprot:XP_010228153.1 uncharacterized acetyltransferase At3g50280 [Brachypodium distachyon]
MAVRVLSTRTVRPPPPETPCSPRLRIIPLASWDVAMLSCNYIQKGLLFSPPPPSMSSTAALVQHLAAALSETLADYYPVAGRFVTDKHHDSSVGCSVSIDCARQGVEVIHAVADGVSMADVIPPDADVPPVVESFFPLNGAVCHDGHELPLFAAQITELAHDGTVFLGFACNHALADGAAFWDFLNAWAQISRSGSPPPSSRRRPLLDRWSPSAAKPIVLPCGDVADLIDRSPPPGPPLRSRMLRFSADTLAALKNRARTELLASGDAAGAEALTRFQALSSLMWRCITRARNNHTLPPETETKSTTTCRAAINNRGRLHPPLPPEYFGNCIDAVSTDSVSSSDLLLLGHGWAAAAVGRSVAAHTDEDIRARVAAWVESPVVYTARWYDPRGTFMGSSPRFDMYGCDFGWGKPAAVRSGKANKVDGRVSLYPGREGGMDAEVSLTPEHMAALELDHEFWAAVLPEPGGKAKA